jgi:hypothetical protein
MVMVIFRRLAPSLAAIAALMLSGCGGGGGSTPNVVANSLPQTQQTASVTFTIVIPSASGTSASAKRGPLYVSSSTKSATVAVTPSGGSAGTPAVIACTSSSCSGTISAPVGSDAFAVNLYDGTGGSGSLLSTGTLQQTIVANEANSVTVTFNGVVASLTISLNPTSIIPGTSGTATVTVNALDADGNIIVGPGVYADASGAPVTIDLANSDTSGASSLSASNLTQPTTGITLSYTTALAASPTITASASGVTSAHASLQFLAPTLTAIGSGTGLIGTSVSETITGTNFGMGATVAVGGSGVTVSGVTVTGSTSITATFFIDAEAATGARNVTVTTAGGTTSAQSFTISNTGVSVVTLATDTTPGTPPGTGTGASGDLRHAILNASAGTTIVFDTTAMCGASSCTITLAGPLPPIAQNLTIDGGYFGRVIVDGANAYRAFWVDSGTVTLANLQIQHANATGGSGEDGGGGGAGLGAGLFVHGGGVSVVNDAFVDNIATGGSGGTSPDGGGGGGLGGNGGAYSGISGSGGGGGGVLGAGGDGATNGGTGGIGFSGTGGGTGGGSGGNGGVGASGAGGGGGGSLGGSGGFGGFGGGGGGGALNLGTGGNGGAGGFGGGGGGGHDTGAGGAGGAGGGGGGSDVGTSGSGGALATLSGGNGFLGTGGGGVAAGPAIFVYAGTLTTVNSDASGSSAIGGTNGAGADPTPVFNYLGTINGVPYTTAQGGVASALGSTTP